MIDIAAIQTFDQELPWEAEILTYLYRLLVNYLRSKVLCNAAVVDVAKLISIVLMIE